jgi:STE24 endopeptidase
VGRILPLIPLILWLTWSETPRQAVGHSTINAAGELWVSVVPSANPTAPLMLVAGLVVIVSLMVAWSRLVIGGRQRDPYLSTRRFQHGMLLARVAIVAWYGYCLHQLGFGTWMDSLLAPMAQWPVRVPSLILGTLPVFAAFAGLWLATYPVELLTRERNHLSNLDDGLPVRGYPTFRSYASNNFRLQILFMIVPVIAVLALRDLVVVGCAMTGVTLGPILQACVLVGTVAAIFVLSPVLLRWVLKARPLPPGALRTRLESLSAQLGVKCRDILLWQTDYSLGNAAVMGIVPRFRYILLTDLLVETLNERQIEAVFAHEAGHVRHRHMVWYVVFFTVFMLALYGPLDTITRMVGEAVVSSYVPVELIAGIGSVAVFIVLFGMLSRLFERQADLYAARAMELTSVPNSRALTPMQVAVGATGAMTFAGALRRVAEINHMPADRMPRRRGLWAPMTFLLETAQNFQHPSIPDRIDHVMQLSIDPDDTARFDRRVVLVMLGLMTLGTLLAAWAGVNLLRAL